MREQVQPKPWRHRLRVSVRGLAVLVLVIGGLLGWAVRSARIQRNAVAAILDAGGTVQSRAQLHGHWINYGKFWVPTWAVDRIGVDYFVRIDAVSLDSAIDATLLHAGQLTGLRKLRLPGSSVTDKGLRVIETLTELRSLDLAGASISDDGLKSLEGLTELRVLSLGHTKIGDQGLIHLGRLTNLRVLLIPNCQVTMAGSQALQRVLPQVLIYHAPVCGWPWED
jgi:hypothetical protein